MIDVNKLSGMVTFQSLIRTTSTYCAYVTTILRNEHRNVSQSSCLCMVQRYGLKRAVYELKGPRNLAKVHGVDLVLVNETNVQSVNITQMRETNLGMRLGFPV